MHQPSMMPGGVAEGDRSECLAADGGSPESMAPFSVQDVDTEPAHEARQLRIGDDDIPGRKS